MHKDLGLISITVLPIPPTNIGVGWLGREEKKRRKEEKEEKEGGRKKRRKTTTT